MHLTAENEDAFDILFCIAFEMMDAQWLAMHASYMNFKVHFLFPMFFESSMIFLPIPTLIEKKLVCKAYFQVSPTFFHNLL